LPTAKLKKRTLKDPRVIKRLRWVRERREEQKTPEGEWLVWLLLAGRGYGKTRTAAEDVAWYGLNRKNSLIAIVAETFADGRDVCIEGESGLISCLPRKAITLWNRSIGELFLTNGTKYKIYSGDKPDGLRGYQHHRAWVDELAKFRYARETWTQLMLGLRLGDDPRVVVTTTPKPLALLKDLMARENVHVTRGSTFDNAPNLAPTFIEEVRRRYEGTRTGRQELHGEYLEDTPGALWTRQMVDENRIPKNDEALAELGFARVVVAIDPAVTSGEDSDETGIVVAALGADGRAYVLDDKSCRLSPDGWASRAVDAYHTHQADRIVAETNNGGDLVERVIRTVSPRVAYRKVHASRGKRVRAEPVAALYEQGRVSHVGSFPDLEDQMCSFTPEGNDSSPDRVDALVWALTDLMLKPAPSMAMV
jgi:predicted phage terminase large subunit-like protein